MIAIAITHYFIQRYFDRRDGIETTSFASPPDTRPDDLPPLIYAILPIVPIGLVLVFSKLAIATIKMPVVTAMLMSIALAMVFEFVHKRDIKSVAASIQVFFDGMGKIFATVVSLIVAGETFANGLMKIGAIDQIIAIAESSGFGAIGITLIMFLIVGACAVIMGSGNAPYYSFGALVPDITAKMGVSSISMITTMQFSASIARSASPITAAVVAVAGVAEVSPVDLVKRTAIPMAVALIVSFVAGVTL